MVKIVVMITVFLSSVSYAAEYKILNIASYHPENTWTADCIEGIESVFDSKYQLKNCYLDTKRIPPSEFQNTANLAWEIYKNYHPDLVMLGDDNAVKLLGSKIAAEKIPLVHYGVNNNPRVYFGEKFPANVYGVLERPLILPWIRYLKQIVPNLEQILIMFDASSSSEAVISVTYLDKKNLSLLGIKIDLKVTDKLNEWENIIKQANNNYQAIIIVNHFTIKDNNGKTIGDREIMTKSSSISSIPIFATNNFAVNSKGAVGAFVIVGQDHGKEAANMAVRILNGDQNIIKFTMQRAGKFYFNKEQLKRFDLKLPDDIEKVAVFQ